VGAITAGYATRLAVGTTTPALLGIPIAAASNWRVSLGVWAAGAVVAAVPWIAQLVVLRRRPLVDPEDPGAERPEPALEARLVRSRIAWALTGMFAASGITAYIVFGWLPEILQGVSGVDAGTGGALLALFAIMGFPDIYQAADAVPRVLEHKPIALEGVDELLVDHIRTKHLHAEDLDGYPLPGRSAYVTLTAAFGGPSSQQRMDSR